MRSRPLRWALWSRARRELIVGGKPRARWAWDDAVRAPPTRGVGTPRFGEDDFEAAPDEGRNSVLLPGGARCRCYCRRPSISVR
jgi:hypothetical protein